MLLGVPQDEITVLVQILVVMWGWCLALGAYGQLEVSGDRAHCGQVVIQPSHKLVIAVAWRERMGQVEALVVQLVKLEFGGKQASEFCVWGDG